MSLSTLSVEYETQLHIANDQPKNTAAQIYLVEFISQLQTIQSNLCFSSILVECTNDCGDNFENCFRSLRKKILILRLSRVYDSFNMLCIITTKFY